MNKMKKALLLALSLAMSATLFAACGKDKGNGGNTSSSSAAGSEVSTPVESESSEESSSEAESESSSEPEVVKYSFTKIDGNPRDPNATITTVELEAGAMLDLTAPDPVEGKTFNGWVDGTGTVYSGTMPEDHLTLYADWTITPYTVTIKQEGQAYKVLKFGVEDDYDDLENPIIGIQSLTFVLEGELPADEEETTYSYEGIPETWELKNYEVTIVATTKTYTFTKINGNPRAPGAVTSVELEAGATLDLSAPAPVDGKVFNGWVDGTGEVYTGTTMPKEPVTLYADWTITPYTVTIKQEGQADKVLKFGVESDYDDLTNPIIGIEEMPFVIEGEIPADTRTTKYTATGIPETWALDNYEIVITAEKIDDDDLAGTITFFDRLNKKVLMADGNVKENKDNYWDGTAGSVTATTQGEVTNGSDFARKITINYNNLTEEEKAAGDIAYGGGWAGQMWVGFAVPVGGIDVNSHELVFDMKLEGMSTTISAYSARVHTGDLGADYEFGAEARYKQSDVATELGDGWYRWTIEIKGDLAVDKAADWIILSIDNCVDPTKEAVGYIDNVSVNEVIYHTVTVDGEEQEVREGTEFTLEDPKKDGYKFLGWVDAEENPITLPITVTADCVINSTWELAPIELSIGANNVVLPEIEGEYVSDAIFTGSAGKYTIVTTGIKAINKETQEVVTEFELAEDGSFTFVLVEGDDWETEGTVKILKEYVPEIPATARKVLNSALKESAVSTAEDVAAPEGFTSAMKFTSTWKDDYIHMGANGDKTALTNYTDIFFALKLVNGKYIDVGGDHYTSDAWLYMHYVQTAATTWTLYAKAEDSSFEKTIVGIDTTAGDSANYLIDAMSTLMYKGSADVCITPHKANADASADFYTTEVVGVTKPFQHDVPEAATVATASIFADEKGVAADAAVPAGFTSVSKYASAWAEGGALHLGTEINKTDLSEYSDIYFAIRVENATLTVYDSVSYQGTGWVYVHYTQTAEATWTANIKSDDGTLNLTKAGIDATAGGKAYPLNAISTLLYKGARDVNFYVYNTAGSDAGILYSTEVRGVKKA